MSRASRSSWPFHLGIDQQDRIWVTNAIATMSTRFPASDPTKVEKFKTGYSGSGLGIDSQGNVWVTNRFGNSMRGWPASWRIGRRPEDRRQRRRDAGAHHVQAERRPGRRQRHSAAPDGSQYPGSPFTGGGLPGPWAATIDGNDNVWISNFAMRTVRSCSCAAPAPRTARRASRRATRFRRPAAMSEAACRCRPISRSIRRAMSG